MSTSAGLGRLLQIGGAWKASNSNTILISARRSLVQLDASTWEKHHKALIDVTDLANRMREQVRVYTQENQVRMVGILAHASPFHADAEIYSSRIQETFEQDGIDYQVYHCSGQRPSDIEAIIRQMNERSDVHGILVFYPIFQTTMQTGHQYLNKTTGVRYKTPDDYLRDVVCPTKDVEGLNHNHSSRRLFRARGMARTESDIYVPCTALSVLKILEAHHPSSHDAERGRWSGCTVTVVNRSEIFGRPLAALLALQGAKVYSVDESSILVFDQGRMRRCTESSLEDCLQQSSIVVSGVPSPDFLLPSKAIAPGSTVVNVSEFLNVCVETLLQRPNVRLVPHVGKVTVAALEQNLIRLHQRTMQNSC